MKKKSKREFESSSKGRQKRCAPVLVLGEPSLSSYIRRGLEQRGYTCCLAASCDEAVDLFRSNGFALIVSMMPIEEGHPLLSDLGGSKCTVVFYRPGGGDHCWVPVMNRGMKCFAAPALRPSEFIDLVHQTITEADEEPPAWQRHLAG